MENPMQQSRRLPRYLCVAGLLGAIATSVDAQQRSPNQRPRTSGAGERDPHAGPVGRSVTTAAVFPAEFRSTDGHGNNTGHAEWGAADTTFLRLMPAAYADGAGSPAGADLPSARAISNLVVAQPATVGPDDRVTDFVWQWGQFLDHDITETPVAAPSEPFDIAVPAGDPWFDPTGTGTQGIPLDRSAYEIVDGTREQINLITAFVDGSMVYGSEDARADALRTLDGTGRLKTSAGGYLPYNTGGLPNAGSTAESFFLAGDIRANEQVGLTVMHTLFVREHNFWADALGAHFPGMSAGMIFELSRALVAAEIQAITYNEFLPVLLGRDALRPYRGYRADVDPGIANEFATAGYRVGHTMLSPQLLRLEADGSPHELGPLSLAEAFFAPSVVVQTGLEPILRGLATQPAQTVDPSLVDEVRNLLFGPPGSGGLDLAALNLQRGRDHGLPSYNAFRRWAGLPPVADVRQISPDPEIRSRLQRAYPSVDAIDPWVGMLAEPKVPGALVGRTHQRLLADQFERLRDGDRFFYEAYLPVEISRFVRTQTLAVIIRRNTDIRREIRDNVFLLR